MTHQEIADLDGEMERSQVSDAVRELRKRKVIEGNGSYAFLPPAQWRAGARAREGRQALQARLEAKFERMADQLDMKLWELDAELKSQFLAGVSETPKGVGQTLPPTGNGVSETPKGVSQTRAPSAYNVGTDRHIKRSTGTVRDGSMGTDLENSRLRQIKQFMEEAHGHQLASAEMEQSGGMWRGLARSNERVMDGRYTVWEMVEQTMSWIRDQERTGNPTQENRAQRLTGELKKRALGEEVWGKIFSKR